VLADRQRPPRRWTRIFRRDCRPRGLLFDLSSQQPLCLSRRYVNRHCRPRRRGVVRRGELEGVWDEPLVTDLLHALGLSEQRA
jgi:hypothetical protein